jgi:hypothetical protein
MEIEREQLIMPQPRFTFPVSFRQVDKPVFDALVAIAHEEKCDVTRVFRTALTEFVKTRAQGAGRKLDEFLDDSAMAEPIYNRVLTPLELKAWKESEVLSAARLVRARKDELEMELKRRGYFFRW